MQSEFIKKKDANANTAFYATTTSEFEVVAYNENWVAIWGEGGVERMALSSSVFVTLDGMPIKATCYNIEG